MADNKLIRPPKTNLFFGSEGVKEDFKDESNTVPNSKDEILNFTNSQIYKTGLAYYSRWENGLVLDTFNTSTYIDSHRTAYLYQQGIPEFDKTQNYFHGSLFLIGSVPHVVIGSDLSYTTKVDFSTTPDFTAYTGTSSTDLFTQSLTAPFADFRTKCLPLHLYQEGLTRPVISGLNLVDKYPTFFTNSDGGTITTYNNGRQKFIDVNLPFLKNGTTYKSFNVPQGFGLVNNQTNMGTTTGGGDGAGISAVDNHVLNFVTVFAGTHNAMYFNRPNNDAVIFRSVIKINEIANNGVYKEHPDHVKKNSNAGAVKGTLDPDFIRYSNQIYVDVPTTSPTANKFDTGSSKGDNYWGFNGGYEDNPTTGMWLTGSVLEKWVTNGGAIDKAWLDAHPNTGAGLQLGYYTLLKQL